MKQRIERSNELIAQSKKLVRKMEKLNWEIREYLKVKGVTNGS